MGGKRIAGDRGFLEKLYAGFLDERVFHSFSKREDSRRVLRAVERYREIVADWSLEAIEAAGRIPDEMLERMRREGMFGLTIPEAYGGSGFGLREYLRLVEELVKLDISVAFVSLAHLSIGMKGIQLFGDVAQKEKYLVPAATGEMIFSFALTEPRVGSDAQHIETKAELSEDGAFYVLNGSKTYITNANYAGGITVFAQMDPKKPGFMGAFVVETAWEGVKIGRGMPKMGLKASSTAAIQFKNVRVPVENLLGAPGDGFKIAMAVLNYGRLGLGAASVGIMDRSLEDMKKRSASRMQFGSPIMEFPLIQEKIVKTKVNAFVSSCMNDFTAGLLEEDPLANVAMETSHCKLFGTTRAWDAVYDGLQTAGGAGYISTQPYEKRMRDFRVTTVFEGTTEIHSIYPALFMLRQFGKEIQKAGGKVAGFSFLLKNLFIRTAWPLKFDENAMGRASEFARGSSTLVRRMLSLGLLTHGKKLAERQFLLRRITAVSLYLFGMLCMLSRMESDQEAGRLDSEELDLLKYFLEEAKEARKRDRRIADSRKERLTGLICRRLFRGVVK